MSVQAPKRPIGLPAPRPKLRKYKYIYDENPDLCTIVVDIINDLPIEQVEPELYPQLLPILRDRERALKEWRNQPASRSIGVAIQHIENYRYCNDPNQLQPRSMRSMRISSNKLSPTELSINVDLAIRGEFRQIDPKHYNVIVKELVRLKSEALSDGDYLLAEKCVNASRKVRAMTSDNKFVEMATARVDELAEQLAIKGNDRDEVIGKWEKAIAEAERKRDADLKRMEKENERELRIFDKQFETEPPPDMRKFSGELLQLRTRERYMVQSGRYTEATEARAEAERLTAKETEEHKQKWMNVLKLKRAELVKKQQDKMYIRKVNADNQIAKMKRQSIAEIDHQEKALQHVESHYEDATVVQNFSSVGATSRGTTRRDKRLPRLAPANPAAAAFRQRAMINTIVYSKTAPKTAR